MTKLTGFLAFFVAIFLGLTGFSGSSRDEVSRSGPSYSIDDSRDIFVRGYDFYSGGPNIRQIASRPLDNPETIRGSIENLDLKHNRFDVRDSGDKVTTVVVARNASRGMTGRVKRLKEGEIVRLQGRYRDSNRNVFEARDFLDK